MGAVAVMSWKHPKVWIPAIVALLFVIVLLQNTDVVTLRVLFWDVSMAKPIFHAVPKPMRGLLLG